MKSMYLIACWIVLAFVFTGCVTTQHVCATRTISVVSGTARSERPDYQKIEATLAGVADLLTSRGWQLHTIPLAYHVTGGRIYHDNFSITHFGCSAEMDRKSATFRFYEWEQSPHSGIFPATDEQRAGIRALAQEVEVYLKDRLPASYDIHLSIF
jgi:hypothetical protein